ncbi:MAG: serine hydrolase [Cyclobacteriaceae bacterium]
MKVHSVILASLVVLFQACQPHTTPLQKLEQKLVETMEGCSGEYAVAYYDLTSGESMQLNADKKYHAASTMKVPVMIELYRQASLGNLSMSDSILVRNEFISIVDSSLYTLSIEDDSDSIVYQNIGKKMSLADLTYQMITVSSNFATNILIQLVGGAQTTATMRTLGARDIEVLRGVEDIKAYEQGLSNSTTANDLLSIFTALAKGEAGTAEHTEEMIGILKDQAFNEIIPAKLPTNVQVAHKTGVITGVHHDAGIVYLPDGRSYVLILLSEKLEDFDRCTEMMASLSRVVYDHMISKAN